MPAIANTDSYYFAWVGLGCARLLLPLQPEMTVLHGVPVVARYVLRDVRRHRHEAAHLPGLRPLVLRSAQFGSH